MAPGILFVASATLSDDLPSDKFCDWYENKHIQEVTALSGVTGAVRYEQIDGVQSIGQDKPWLTTYELPDLDFKDSDEFKALDGQSTPNKELFETIFKNAAFDSRFYEMKMDHHVDGVGEGSGQFALVAAIQPFDLKMVESEALYEHVRTRRVPVMMKIKGYRRLRVYVLKSASKLEASERSANSPPPLLAYYEFDGDKLPVLELLKVMDKEMSTTIDFGNPKLEFSFWTKKRGYGVRDGVYDV